MKGDKDNPDTSVQCEDCGGPIDVTSEDICKSCERKRTYGRINAEKTAKREFLLGLDNTDVEAICEKVNKRGGVGGIVITPLIISCVLYSVLRDCYAEVLADRIEALKDHVLTVTTETHRLYFVRADAAGIDITSARERATRFTEDEAVKMQEAVRVGCGLEFNIGRVYVGFPLTVLP